MGRVDSWSDFLCGDRARGGASPDWGEMVFRRGAAILVLFFLLHHLPAILAFVCSLTAVGRCYFAYLYNLVP